MGDVKDQYSSSQVFHKVEDFRYRPYQQVALVQRNKIAIGDSFELVPMGFRMVGQNLALAHESSVSGYRRSEKSMEKVGPLPSDVLCPFARPVYAKGKRHHLQRRVKLKKYRVGHSHLMVWSAVGLLR
jgi:hypothetical protein